jgi:hypothetical protein
MSHRTDRCYERLMALIGLLALSAMLPIQSANAAVKTRQFTFENGTVGGSAATILNTVTGPFTGVPPATFGGVATDFFDTGGLSIPDSTPVQDWVTANYDSSPDYTAQGTAPVYVNVANASPLDSPAPGSNVGLQFNGTNVLTGQGFRGTYITDAALASNAAANGGTAIPDGGTVSTSFTVLAQGWVRPSVAGQGTVQTVWALGTDLGAPRITADGFWEMANVSVIPDTVTTKPVVFGQWQHVALLRTGGAATLYINGAVVVAAQNFFGAFPTESFVGNSIDGTQPFNGVLDNFAISGIGGLGFTVATDIDYFTDVGLPPPTGVAGDVNQDGLVNQSDYNVWSMNVGFNNTFGQGDLTTLVKGDLDGNGKIDFFDFRIIARQAAAAGVSLSVPEPASGVLIALLAVAGLTCRRAAVVR